MGTSMKTLWQKGQPQRRDRGSPAQRLYLRLPQLSSLIRNACGASARFW